MGKDKLKKFAENKTFRCLVQPEFDEIFGKDHPLKGRWHADFFRNDRPIVLELGCGKGEYTVARAEADPETLFVGIDVDPICVMRSAEAACEAGAGNVVFVHDEDPDVLELFGEGELASILINFPTPFPKKKRAPRRLTYLDRLMKYRLVLEDGGTVRMRTDSTPFRDFSLTQLELAGYTKVIL